MKFCIGFVKISKTSYSDIDVASWCLKFCCVWFLNRKIYNIRYLICIFHIVILLRYSSPVISELCAIAAVSLKILILCGTFCHKLRGVILY